MEIFTSGNKIKLDPAAANLLEFLRNNEVGLELKNALVYYDFPLFRSPVGKIIVAKVIVLSPQYGLVLFGTSNSNDRNVALEFPVAQQELDDLYTFLFSKLLQNRLVVTKRKELVLPLNAAIYSPFAEVPEGLQADGTPILRQEAEITNYLESLEKVNLGEELILTVRSVMEGSQGLNIPKSRNVNELPADSKGFLATSIETAIGSFDKKQRHGWMSVNEGVQRIRGLAGSGKTVVLALKAALMHLRYPEATIVYTFYTKSLYQLVQNLITRFYRQYDDKDPDWEKIKILHGWGGYRTEGLYSLAARSNGVQPLSFSQAQLSAKSLAPFDFACQQLLDHELQKKFDFIFIDEGQDFPDSFVKLCVALAKEDRVVWAYDEFQSIWQTTAPSPEKVLGPGKNLSEDIVLYRCYRNPREIIVAAHALGLGLYGSGLVQMLENKEHWEDVGYSLIKGEFREGDQIEIFRPEENSLPTISQAHRIDEIVKGKVFKDFSDEVDFVASSIQADIEDGLRPDDILVVVADDRNARNYLAALAEQLAARRIASNDIHSDSYSVKDFSLEDRVTLSTVHKAKGNEAFMVYVVGVDALFSFPGIKERNMIFTAMTRAKGWIRITGVGESAKVAIDELGQAIKNFPFLRFTYPSEEQLRVMRRGLKEADAQKLQAERTLEKLLEQMTPDQIKRFVDQRTTSKGKQTGSKKPRAKTKNSRRSKH